MLASKVHHVKGCAGSLTWSFLTRIMHEKRNVFYKIVQVEDSLQQSWHSYVSLNVIASCRLCTKKRLFRFLQQMIYVSIDGWVFLNISSQSCYKKQFSVCFTSDLWMQMEQYVQQRSVCVAHAVGSNNVELLSLVYWIHLYVHGNLHKV